MLGRQYSSIVVYDGSAASSMRPAVQWDAVQRHIGAAPINAPWTVVFDYIWLTQDRRV